MCNEIKQGDDLRADYESPGAVQLAGEQAPSNAEQGPVWSEGESWVSDIQGVRAWLRRELNDGSSDSLSGNECIRETAPGSSLLPPVLPPRVGLQFELWGEDQQGEGV